MFPYIPHSDKDKAVMLDAIGVDSIESLFDDVPQDIRLGRSLNIGKSLSEIELRNQMRKLAGKNTDIRQLTCFLGAGAYDHYIPAVVDSIASRSEFYTAYTPYQPEISQGTLQAIFEYQTMICNLTGMDVSNASMYDGATAAAEAGMIASENTKRSKVVVSKTVHPDIRRVVKTYMKFNGIEYVEVDESEGVTDIDKLKSVVDSKTAGVIVQNPNFFGIIEDFSEVEKHVHSNKAMLIMHVDPISLGILKTPGEIGADFVVGDGQSLGNSLYFGGPYLGFMAATNKLVRKMPGRIVGQSEDTDGKRAFVLTLQAREQHIRRAKATSNICSNQSLNALKAAVYMSLMGKSGIKAVALQAAQKAHYAQKELTKSGKYKPLFNKPFFKEFALKADTEVGKINEVLLENGILGGFDLGRDYPSCSNSLMICVTEKRTREEIDNLVRIMEGI
jgi:glycine dehydrogenase subunit 1